MSRLAQKQPSVCTSEPLADSEAWGKMVALRQILASCLGPQGRLKQVHNSVGGPVLTTSTSGVLLRALTLSHPIPKLLSASVLHHVSRYSDCGLFAGVLALALVEQARGLAVPAGAVAAAFRRLLGVACGYLRGHGCGCRVAVDLGSSRELLGLARSVVGAKPTCALTAAETGTVAMLVVRAFLHCVPCGGPGPTALGRVAVVPVAGRPVGDSAVLPGVLVHMPEALRRDHAERLEHGPLRLALFSVSLAGDLPEPGDGELELHCELSLEETVLEQLLELGAQVVQDGVQVLACQRVVHPVLQQRLWTSGVVVLERLGFALMEPLVRMTGAQAVASFQTPVPAQCYGQLAGLRVQRYGSKEMLHLLPCGEPPGCTLLLCQRTDTALSELKVACESAEHVLRQTLKEPWALLGGGCTETHLSAYIKHQSRSDAAAAAAELDCTRSDYLQAADAFCRALLAVARALEHDGGERVLDLTHAHCWAVPAGADPQAPWGPALKACGCGLTSPDARLQWSPLRTEHPPFSPAPSEAAAPAQPLVLDSYPAKLNALQVAVETANLILDLRYIVQDVN